MRNNFPDRLQRMLTAIAVSLVLVIGVAGNLAYADSVAPIPVLTKDGKPVDWWFVFKFNTQAFPGCANQEVRACPFGGTVQNYRMGYSQQYVYASSEDAALKAGDGCLGDSTVDPVAATFDQVYHGHYNYVIWNDQFYGDPIKNGNSPWGHSKGLLAWNDDGNGFVMQVTTPSWPAAGNEQFPRKYDGNSLGCVTDDNVEVSQHFFAVRLNVADLEAVLRALQNASVVTDPSNPQIVHNGGPVEVQRLVRDLGHKSKSKTYTAVTLSSGIGLISKPSKLHVPPWQLVSASLNGVPLRTATWWARPKIPSTTAHTQIACWDDNLSKPGAVVIAKEGHWQSTTFSLTGGTGRNHNHAKIGVSIDPNDSYAIFGDMNQQGALSGNCKSSQNGRGGLFYVVHNSGLNRSIMGLLQAK